MPIFPLLFPIQDKWEKELNEFRTSQTGTGVIVCSRKKKREIYVIIPAKRPQEVNRSEDRLS
jgi:hypothetical protein